MEKKHMLFKGGMDNDSTEPFEFKPQFMENITIDKIVQTPEELMDMFKRQGLMIFDPTEFPTLTLTILGEPTSQKRHRSVKMGGFTRQYDPSSADKADFLSIVQKEAPETPFTTPLNLTLNFYFSRPKSHYKTGKNSEVLKDNSPTWHTARPDCDNLAKFVMDALNKVYWRDDSLICSITVKKQYSDNPRTEIQITKI